jgi:hypothetical protein
VCAVTQRRTDDHFTGIIRQQLGGKYTLLSEMAGALRGSPAPRAVLNLARQPLVI